MAIWRKRWEILVFLVGAKAIYDYRQACWANSASQYSARWTHIPTHSPYSPNMHRFHHNFLNPTTSPTSQLFKKKNCRSLHLHICITVMSPSALKNAEDQRWAGSFLKKIKLRWKAATFLFTYTQNLNITMSWFEFFTKVIKKVVRGFLGSGDEIVTLAVGTYNATRPLFLLLLASILSKENENTVHGRAL